MLRFVFRLLLPTPVSPIDCCLVPPGSDVLLARCLVAFNGFCGFCEWPMRPDCCAPPAVSARSRLPGFSICCFVDPPPPPAFCRYGVLRFRRLVSRPRFFSGFPRRICFPRFRRLLPVVAAPAFSCSVFFRRPPVSLLCCVAPILFLSPFVIGPSLFPIASFRFRFPGRGVPVSVSSFFLPASVAPL